ncbi:MAG TPA: hypothetical protein VF339_20015 [Gammaproteobacteria bacterium]
MIEVTNQVLVFGWISLLVIGIGVIVVLGALYAVVHQKSLGAAVVGAIALGATMMLHPVLASVSYENGNLQLAFQKTRELSGIAAELADELAQVSRTVEALAQEVKDLAEQVRSGAGTGSALEIGEGALSDIVLRTDELSNAVSTSAPRFEELQRRSIDLAASLPTIQQ